MPESRKHHRVFVVHDEFVIASSLAAILCHQGFDARSFTDPLRALSAAASEPPQLLISDFSMPLLSGSELASQVREYSPACKVLLFSTRQSKEIQSHDECRDQYFQILAVPSPKPDLSMSAKPEAKVAY